jgi:hypothetical protein
MKGSPSRRERRQKARELARRDGKIRQVRQKYVGNKKVAVYR